MANISEIIKNKMTRDQARVEELRAERGNLSAMRDSALEEITTKPERYQQYLTLQGGNIRCSVGNVALTMFQLEGATKIGSIDFWHQQNRYVLDEAMNSGAKVFVPPKNPNHRGYFMGSYYDVSQTSGRPMKDPAPLTDGTPRMEAALAALMDQSPVAMVEDKEISAPAYYDESSLTIYINPEHSESAVFAALATEIAYARAHDRGYNKGYKREIYKLDSESVGYMVCRRFGVECPAPDARFVSALYDGYEPGNRGEALEQMRGTARSIGDGIDQKLNPRQQERSNRRHGSR
ncbi:MAG: hypothetical protein K2P04_06100 [Oscillospiraceae bacterium]|nr:hypothetical protein [Oscillospiraceae bacterium]